MPQHKPAICRLVYYRTRQGRDLAAVITRVNDDDTVDLTVYTTADDETPILRIANCENHPEQAPEQAPGVPGNTWRWPRVA